MTAGTFALRRAAVVYVALLCAVEVLALEDQTTIQIPQSASTSTTAKKFNCVPPTPVTRVVRFQTIKVGVSQYERISMSDEVLNFYFHEGANYKTFIAASHGLCLLAAGKAGMDAIQFVDNTCTGYNLSASDIMCRCSSGTNVVFVKSSKIQSTVPKGGFKKTDGNVNFTLAYSTILLESINEDNSEISGDCFTNRANMATNLQYHNSEGSCLGSYAIIDTSQCTSSCSMTSVVVISPLNPSPNIYFLNSCDNTITIPLSPDTTTPTVIQSHLGYGCSLYPQPATDTDCAVTFVGADATVGKLTFNFFLALSVEGTTCQDDLTIYEGTDSSGTALTETTCTAGQGTEAGTSSEVPIAYVVFKRRALPGITGSSPPIGFYLTVSGTASTGTTTTTTQSITETTTETTTTAAEGPA